MAHHDALASLKVDNQTSDDWLANFLETFDTVIAGESDDFALGAAETVIRDDMVRGLCDDEDDSKYADDADDNGKRGRSMESGTLSEGAKKNKSKREKRRRDALNDKFMELSAVLEPGSVPKTDKAKVVVAATALIKKLRDHHHKLTEMIVKIQSEKTRQQEMNSQLIQEKTTLLHEKLRIEAQLQAYLTSMPFASPLGGVVTSVGGKVTAIPAGIWAFSAPFPTPFLEPTNAEVEDVTLRAPVA